MGGHTYSRAPHAAAIAAANARASPEGRAPAAAPLDASEALTADAETLVRPCAERAVLSVDAKEVPDAVDWKAVAAELEVKETLDWSVRLCSSARRRETTNVETAEAATPAVAATALLYL